MPTLAEEIRRLRGDSTLRAFGQRVGVSGSYISQLEHGQPATISFELAAKICAEFGLPMDHFVPILAPGVTVPPPPALPVKKPAPAEDAPAKKPKRKGK